MAFTQADLDRLDAAIARGTLSVEIEGRRVVYRTMNELLAARNHVQNQLSAASGGGTITKTFASFSRD